MGCEIIAMEGGRMVNEGNQSIHAHVCLLGIFLLEKQEEQGVWRSIEQDLGKNNYARGVLKRLLCTPGRCLSREKLIKDVLPPTRDPSLAERYLRDAAYRIRQALGKEALSSTPVSYHLADQASIWTDLDECEALMREAERLDLEQARQLLEKACRLYERGEPLEGETGLWRHAICAAVEQEKKSCFLALAYTYEQLYLHWNAKCIYRKLLTLYPLDEAILCSMLAFLQRIGLAHEATTCYEQARRSFAEEGLELSASTQALAKRLAHIPISPEALVPPLLMLQKSQVITPHVLTTQGILKAEEDHLQEQKGQNMDAFRRHLLGAVAATIVTPTAGLTDLSLVNRFSQILAQPAEMEERTVQYLATKTSDYWQDRTTDALAPYDLLGYVAEHFLKILSFLERSMLPSERARLCAIAGETALLIGALFFELGDNLKARAYHQTVVQAAREANFPELEAAGWGWMSFTWSYSQQHQEALSSIQHARSFVTVKTDVTMRAWLAVIEAEVQAHLNEKEACLRAFSDADCIQDERDIRYGMGIDCLKLLSYKGASFPHLYSPQDAASTRFLVQAQEALSQALASVNPTLIRRRSTMHTDMAGIYLQQGALEEMYQHASQAIGLALQAKSQVAAQRVMKLRNTLAQHKDNRYVSLLDEQLEPFYLPEWYQMK
ncbi:hypothetical protein EPA93_09345 [Ktedonosporobacter rubrisoli]|uniref:Bacterial transcriptional activator domain-containing protein n=1 Tax=Ktedonosporobacter rubrisoli TaxID=2509675 RepID=A0A4P6JLW3_KTERU|nr:BTAD domain-containing putative transcriptional regulator [Ktedonosporobacter rubrisoli]QBD76204.1 hypothetical protein EPA93_09345 [Ktedonosporobacter rubrisoli]